MQKPDIGIMARQIKDLTNVRIYKNFEQEWGNTGTGFALPGNLYGQSIVKTNVTVLENGKQMFVFLDNELCYTADKNPEIKADIARGFVEGRYRAKNKYLNVAW